MARHECLDTQALPPRPAGENVPSGPTEGLPDEACESPGAGHRRGRRDALAAIGELRGSAEEQIAAMRLSSSSTKALRKRTTATGSAIFLPSCSIRRGRAPGARRGRRREQSPHRRRIASSTRILPGAGDRRRDDHRLPYPRSQRCGAIPEESNKILRPDARKIPMSARAAGRGEVTMAITTTDIRYPDISSKAYEHPADRAATAALGAIPMLEPRAEAPL